MATQVTDLTRPLGSFPMTYSEGSGRWVSETLSVELVGGEWGVSLSLNHRRLTIYMFNDAGDNLFSSEAFAADVSLLDALTLTLKVNTLG